VSSVGYRILVVDDNPLVHEDIGNILIKRGIGKYNLNALESDFLGDEATVLEPVDDLVFELDSAFQGEEGIELVSEARQQGKPYALAIVGARMPPGIDGIDAIEQMQAIDPGLQIVFCTACEDHSWEEIHARVGANDKLIVLKKPFDSIELFQLAYVLASKWSLAREVENKLFQLQTLISDRTEALDRANSELRQRVKDLERMETELRMAQKMEAMGQLSAGIAHEINTPVQFVGDGVYFLQSAFEGIKALFPLYRKSCAELSKMPGNEPLIREVQRVEEEADLVFLLDNIPPTFSRAFDGIERVTTIVKAMKDFAHPGTIEKDYADLNEAIRNTLIVAKGEYKQVAEVEVEFSELPQVLCHIGEINQALLNLIVNAAHAIEKGWKAIK
jgi:two-component system NtrC family sensor kinase